MGIDRRDFIKLAGLSTLLGLGGNSAFELLRPGQVEAAMEPKPEALKAKRWSMVVDMRKMDEITAKKCSEACHKVHNVPDFKNPLDPKLKVADADLVRWEIKWIWTEPYHNAFPGEAPEHMDEKIEHMKFLLLCNHCDNPPCVRVCPTKATFKRPQDGVVMMERAHVIRYARSTPPS